MGRFEVAARSHTEMIRSSMPWDSVFRCLNFHHVGFDGYNTTGDGSLFALGFEGADGTVAAFDERARYEPLGSLDIQGSEQFQGVMSDHGPPPDAALELIANEAITHTFMPATALQRIRGQANLGSYGRDDIGVGMSGGESLPSPLLSWA